MYSPAETPEDGEPVAIRCACAAGERCQAEGKEYGSARGRAVGCERAFRSKRTVWRVVKLHFTTAGLLSSAHARSTYIDVVGARSGRIRS